ncbi:hypothetical protein D3C87_1032280 [compost metagenome]
MTYAILLVAIFFSTTSFAADDLIDMPVPDLQVVELEKAVESIGAKDTSDSSFKGHRDPAAVQTYASAKDRKNMVLTTISSNYPELKGCYHQGLKKDSEMKGKVVMTWDLDAEGKVFAADVENSQLKNKSVEECLVKKFSQWQFPKHAKIQGSTSRMTYTFHFVPENQ